MLHQFALKFLRKFAERERTQVVAECQEFDHGGGKCAGSFVVGRDVIVVVEDVYAGIVGVHGTRYSEAAVVTSAMKVSTTFGEVARLQGLDPVVDAFGGGEHGVSPVCG